MDSSTATTTTHGAKNEMAEIEGTVKESADTFVAGFIYQGAKARIVMQEGLQTVHLPPARPREMSVLNTAQAQKNIKEE